MNEFEYQAAMREKLKDIKSQDDLVSFLNEIASYKHDYCSVVRGLFVAMVATFYHMDNRMGGITGFQAGFLGNLLFQEFTTIKPPYRILNFNNLLYPQYEHDFEKTITMKVWKDIRERARENLINNPTASQKVLDHWWQISKGVVPFGYQVVEK